jgi:GNAT superfamily N-acetyltransferase
MIPYSGAGSLELWTAGLASQAGASQIPGTLVALAGGSLVAVVRLVAADMPGYPPAAGLGPWIKGLYVAPGARGRGHGQLLVRRCEAWARSLGHDALYLFTAHDSAAEALYRGLGWQAIHAGRYEDIEVTVMRTAL